jgi:hypothetical protein
MGMKMANRTIEVWKTVNVESYEAQPHGAVRYFWFQWPGNMTREQAFYTQEHHGPFASEAAMIEDQQAVIFAA